MVDWAAQILNAVRPHRVEAARLAAAAANAGYTDIFSDSGGDSDADLDAGLGSQETIDAKQMLERPGCNVGNKNKRRKVEGDSQSQTSLGPRTQDGQDGAPPVTPALLLGARGVSGWAPQVPSSRVGPRLAVASINSSSWATIKAVLPFLEASVVCSRTGCRLTASLIQASDWPLQGSPANDTAAGSTSGVVLLAVENRIDP